MNEWYLYNVNMYGSRSVARTVKSVEWSSGRMVGFTVFIEVQVFAYSRKVNFIQPISQFKEVICVLFPAFLPEPWKLELQVLVWLFQRVNILLNGASISPHHIDSTFRSAHWNNSVFLGSKAGFLCDVSGLQSLVLVDKDRGGEGPLGWFIFGGGGCDIDGDDGFLEGMWFLFGSNFAVESAGDGVAVIDGLDVDFLVVVLFGLAAKKHSLGDGLILIKIMEW